MKDLLIFVVRLISLISKEQGKMKTQLDGLSHHFSLDDKINSKLDYFYPHYVDVVRLENCFLD